MKLSFYFLIIVSIIFFGCTSQNNSEDDKSTDNVEVQNPEKLNISAAASTQFAVHEIASKFNKKTGMTIDVIVGSSGKLTTQILNGAPYDVMFSANMKYPNILFEKKKGAFEPQVFGYGVPTFWTMDTSIVLDDSGKFLLDEKIEKIVIADPKNAPYGEMAIGFFKKNNIYDQIEKKLVYGESISQVNEHIINQTAQVGVSAKSIILSPKIENKGNYLPMSKEYWVEQGIIELTNGGSSPIKTEFMNFIMSEEGTTILKKYGYEK